MDCIVFFAQFEKFFIYEKIQKYSVRVQNRSKFNEIHMFNVYIVLYSVQSTAYTLFIIDENESKQIECLVNVIAFSSLVNNLN